MADPVVVAPAVLPPTAVAAAVEAAKAPATITPAGYVMLGFGAMIIVALVYIFWAAQRDQRSKIDFVDMLLDAGKLTQGRFWSLVGGSAATWVFVYLPVSGHFDPTYAVGYLAAVFALKVAGDITGKPTPLAPGASESIKETIRTGAAAADPTLAAAAQADLLAAGRGVEPLSPKIGKEDVGKSVALVSKRKEKKRKPHGRAKA